MKKVLFTTEGIMKKVLFTTLKGEGVMKKVLFTTFILLIISSSVIAGTFSPTVLGLSAPEYVKYDFDGTNLGIDVTASGSPAGAYFLVFTKDKADQINAVRNGYLGWHYVNKIDTCVYHSDEMNLQLGSNTIIWDGKDNDGNAALKDEYSYYIWAYDNVNSGVRMSNSPMIVCAYTDFGHIQEMDENGVSLANPLFYSAPLLADRFTDPFGTTGFYCFTKWEIGSDPENVDLAESSYWDLTGSDWSATYNNGKIALQPDNFSYYFAKMSNIEALTKAVIKTQWIPNGEAVIDNTWGDNGYASFTDRSSATTGVITNNADYIYTAVGYRNVPDEVRSDFHIIDVTDGTILNTIDMSEWWCSLEDRDAGGQANGGPDHGFVYRDGYVFMGGSNSCIEQMIDPYAEDEEDFYLWENKNGDYVLDLNYEDDAERPWLCNDYMVAPYKFFAGVDANHFYIANAYGLGAATFGLLAPDGTGLGYVSIAGETAAWKWGQTYCDYGSAYDGIYTVPSEDDYANYAKNYFIHIGGDSIKGTITSEVAVEESPVVFSVEQNSPNPFNPATSIYFTLAEAGKVTVDIYNVAGQKVETVVNESMEKGSHTVVWNGSNFSAGIYFYSVKANGYAKTMKMTLLK